jgi:predicted Fe-Mo cluster-binding NifX family protein
MKIAVPSIGKDLTSHLDLRFGRAKYFLVIDTRTTNYDIIENAENTDLEHHAGVKAANTLLDYDIDILITFNCGPKAFEILSEAGVKIVTGAEGRVIEVVTQYTSGKLEPSETPSVGRHLR